MKRLRTGLENFRRRRRDAERARVPMLQNPSFREWVNVAATIGTVLIGVIGLWNTARISGIEDYFRSEIGVRNSELSRLNRQSERLSAEAEARREQISDLQISTAKLAEQALSQQIRVQESASRLSEMQAKVLGANVQLDQTRSSIRALTAERERQSRHLELIYRRQSVPIISYTGGGYLRLFMELGETPQAATSLEVGKKYREHLNLIAFAGENQLLEPYVRRARERLEYVCPGLFNKTVAVPEIPNEIPPPTQSRSSIRTQADLDAFEEIWASYLNRVRQRSDSVSAASTTVRDGVFGFQAYARSCACKALADNGFTEDDVCKESREPTLLF